MRDDIVRAVVKRPVFLVHTFGRYAGACKVTRWLKVTPVGPISYVEMREHKRLQMPEVISWKVGQITSVTTLYTLLPSNRKEYEKALQVALKVISP